MDDILLETKTVDGRPARVRLTEGENGEHVLVEVEWDRQWHTMTSDHLERQFILEQALIYACSEKMVKHELKKVLVGALDELLK